MFLPHWSSLLILWIIGITISNTENYCYTILVIIDTDTLGYETYHECSMKSTLWIIGITISNTENYCYTILVIIDTDTLGYETYRESSMKSTYKKAATVTYSGNGTVTRVMNKSFRGPRSISRTGFQLQLQFGAY